MSDRLKEIAERAEKATPGPWEYYGGRSIDTPPIHADEANYGIPDEGFEGGYQFYCSADDGAWRYADGEFIAAAREDIPFLLAELQKTIEVLEGFDCLDLDDRVLSWWDERAKPLLDNLKNR